MKDYIISAGGINIDIKGITYSEKKEADSYPGKIYFTPGGVARNVSENLARLGFNVCLLGCTGDDYFGNYILHETHKANVNTDFVIKSPDVKTSEYLSVSNRSGSFFYAVNDMKESTDLIDREYIIRNLSLIENSKMIIADTNLKKDILQDLVAVAAQKNIPIFIDAVSTEKAQTLKDLDGKIDYLSLNYEEYQSIFGKIRKAADIFDKLYSGDFHNYRYIILKKGKSGAGLVEVAEELVISGKSLCDEVKETNGAGDAFNAGFIFGLLNGFNPADSLRAGNCASYFSLQTYKSVSEELNRENLMILFNQKPKSKEY